MDKQIYITEEEREKCQRVVDAFVELYEIFSRMRLIPEDAKKPADKKV